MVTPAQNKIPLLPIWVVALSCSAIFAAFAKPYVPWAFKFPKTWQWALKDHITGFMEWLIDEASLGFFTFTEFTRGIAWVINIPFDFTRSILSTGLLQGQGSDAVQLLPPFSWIAIIAIMIALGRYARDWKLAALAGGCFFYLSVFGQWDSAMITLSSIVIAVPFGVGGGLMLGLLGYRMRWFEKLITPVLDLMQSVPIFAYLVPILFMFGFGPVSAIIATIIYAMPPMVRITILALRSLPSDVIDLGNMIGCTRAQMTWKVLIPTAMPTLMIGVNQVIMLSLNMVIIASMIGAGGLGFDVLSSLRRLDIGAGIESGFAIVVLAIALDRVSQAFAQKSPRAHEAEQLPLLKRYPYSITCFVLVIVTGVLGLVWGAFQTYPESWTLTTGSTWKDMVKYININYYDQLEGVKNFLLLNILIPFKRALLGLPWPVVIGILGLAGWSLGGKKLAALCILLSGFIVLVGLWEKAMITVYLCGISVIIASLIGMPIGILAAEKPKLWPFVQAVIDTLQTLPSFVYLMPVVMLFRVGDFSAMIAVVAYAIAPAIRYTAHGIRQVDPELIEAGIVSGCTKAQVLRKIKLKLALPEIILGLNQTIMLALSMLVITALVGTRDLGQEVYIALAKADTGRGMVAGLCVAFIAIIADRLITASAKRAKARLGLI